MWSYSTPSAQSVYLGSMKRLLPNVEQGSKQVFLPHGAEQAANLLAQTCGGWQQQQQQQQQHNLFIIGEAAVLRPQTDCEAAAPVGSRAKSDVLCGAPKHPHPLWHHAPISLKQYT